MSTKTKRVKRIKHAWSGWSSWANHQAGMEKSSRRCAGDCCDGTTQTKYRKKIYA